MRSILHLRTKQDDALADEVIQRQQGLAETSVKVIELAADGTDYDMVVREIFAADSVEVW